MTDIKSFKINLESIMKNSNQVFIAPHLNADFDAISSAIGFSLISKKFNKPNYIFMCDKQHEIEPGVKSIIDEYKENANFIELDRYLKLKSDSDLLVATDVNKRYLLGCKEYLEEFKDIAVLDHHKPDENSIQTENACILDSVSSTCEAMVDLLSLYGIKYDERVATYLLTGIYLDTDKLRKGCTPTTFQIVSKLMKKGASLEKVQEYFAEDFYSDKKIQALVQKAIFDTFTYALAIETEDIIYTREDLAKVADKLLSYKAVDAAFAVGKIDENVVSISARSKGKLDVSQVMSAMQGGGNVYSAATKLENTDTIEVGKVLRHELKMRYSTE